jgi:hypothetical protein
VTSAFSIGAVVLLWAGMRLVFFEGLCGGDDLAYVSYALELDRLPFTHHETRLLYNGLMHCAIRLAGPGQFAYAAPGLLGSLLLLGAVIRISFVRWGNQGLVIAGVLVATLPIDVHLSTAPFPSSLTVGLAAVGTALTIDATRMRSRVIAAGFFSLSIMAHTTSVFYVAAIYGALALFACNWSQRLNVIAIGACSVVGYFLLHFSVFYALTGDPLYEIRILNSITDAWIEPGIERLSPRWLLLPIANLVFCNAFGFSAILALAGVAVFHRAMSRTDLCLAVACVFFWLWIGYGSQKPNAYEPFWRATRYFHFAAIPVGVLLTSGLMHGLKWPIAGALAIGALHALLLANNGPWGQGIKVSRDLLVFAQGKAQIAFATDSATYRQMIVLNAGKPPANITRSQAAVFLHNPLNNSAAPEGAVVYRTAPQYRLIGHCMSQQFLESHPWFTKRPAGAVIELETE